jgi:hypothetical protein
MVGVAQWAEHRTVDAAVGGSNPLTHPIYCHHISTIGHPSIFDFPSTNELSHFRAKILDFHAYYDNRFIPG